MLLVQIIPHRITDFNPRSPRGERQIACKCKRKGIQISIHAPRGGSDLRGVHSALQTTDFNPRSPRGERLHGHLCAGHLIYISIHAPRGGSDFFRDQVCTVGLYFNPRSPRGERLGWPQVPQKRSLFQSTLPAGGATAKTTKSLRKTCAGSRKC